MNIAAEKRVEFGKNSSYRLREKGMVPAVLYSHGETENIQIDLKDFKNLFKGEISESIIFEIDIKGGEKQDVYVKDYQRHPVTDELEHVDFFKVTKGETIHTRVTVEPIGNPIGSRLGGIFELLERELEVEVLPKDLVEKLEINVEELNIGDGIYVRDIVGPESMVFLADEDQVVAHVVGAKMEEEEEEEVEEDLEGEDSEEASEGETEGE